MKTKKIWIGWRAFYSLLAIRSEDEIGIWIISKLFLRKEYCHQYLDLHREAGECDEEFISSALKVAEDQTKIIMTLSKILTSGTSITKRLKEM